jgi:hypothetical protein
MAESQARASFRQSLTDALATADLRRVEVTWTAARVGAWTYFIVLAVYPYNEGGATAVGVAALAWILAAIAAAVATEAPLAVVLVLSAGFTTLATAHKPAQAALLPALAGRWTRSRHSESSVSRPGLWPDRRDAT